MLVSGVTPAYIGRVNIACGAQLIVAVAETRAPIIRTGASTEGCMMGLLPNIAAAHHADHSAMFDAFECHGWLFCGLPFRSADLAGSLIGSL